jgi:hypothetical protein
MDKQLAKLCVKPSSEMKAHGVYSTFFGQYMIKMLGQFVGEPTLTSGLLRSSHRLNFRSCRKAIFAARSSMAATIAGNSAVSWF